MRELRSPAPEFEESVVCGPSTLGPADPSDISENPVASRRPGSRRCGWWKGIFVLLRLLQRRPASLAVRMRRAARVHTRSSGVSRAPTAFSCNPQTRPDGFLVLQSTNAFRRFSPAIHKRAPAAFSCNPQTRSDAAPVVRSPRTGLSCCADSSDRTPAVRTPSSRLKPVGVVPPRE